MTSPVRGASLVALLLCSTVVPAQQQCDPDSARRSLPIERFVDNGDGTVSDKQLKLMWMRCAVGQAWSDGECTGTPALLDWPAAQETAASLNRDGRYFFNDWRVPSLRDLATITERGCDSPRTNLMVFPSTPARYFWSTSSRPGDSAGDRAYAMSFGRESVELLDKVRAAHVRLVRADD